MSAPVRFPLPALLLALAVSMGSRPLQGSPLAAEDSAWIPIFNGKDLADWVAKFEGKALGENPDSTFKVQGGMLFANNHLPFSQCPFGHLFYTKRKFSHYLIRAEYRFPQEKSASGFATWTNQNNGLMLHSQDPKTLGLGSSFPNSIEVQLLGPKNTNESGVVPSTDWPVGKTANLCTPQSFVAWNGKDHTQHCTPAQYPNAWKGTQIPWDKEFSDVSVRILGDSLATHFIRGEKVFEYSRLRLDNGTPLKDGYVSIQAEGTPTLFRKLEVLDLVGCMDQAKAAYRTYFVKSDPSACGGVPVALAGAGRGGYRFLARDGGYVVEGPGGFTVRIMDLDGAILETLRGNGVLRLPKGGSGVRLVRIDGPAGIKTAKLPLP